MAARTPSRGTPPVRQSRRRASNSPHKHLKLNNVINYIIAFQGQIEVRWVTGLTWLVASPSNVNDNTPFGRLSAAGVWAVRNGSRRATVEGSSGQDGGTKTMSEAA